jgi:predicted HicB family RNase H-like nuclease
MPHHKTLKKLKRQTEQLNARVSPQLKAQLVTILLRREIGFTEWIRLKIEEEVSHAQA